MTDNPIVKLEKTSRLFRRGTEEVHALEDVDLTLSRGEYVAVVGPSGSGKTTLLNIIGCLDRPSRGRVTVAGWDLTGADESRLAIVRKNVIGFVFQQFFLIPTLTVLENVELPLLFTGRNHTRDRARELLVKMGLGNRLEHLPSQLSGGEMQRTAIARSLINNPQILLADEPTGNLDSKNAAMIMDLFDELNCGGITIVVVTHNLDLARRCRRIIRLEDGRVVS